jgi:hypothetical protein
MSVKKLLDLARVAIFSASNAKALVSLLNDSRWGTAMDAVAQSRLIDELTAQRSLERTQPET